MVDFVATIDATCRDFATTPSALKSYCSCRVVHSDSESLNGPDCMRTHSTATSLYPTPVLACQNRSGVNKECLVGRLWEEKAEGYGKGAGFGTFQRRALYSGRMFRLQVPVRRAKSCNKERLLLLDKHHNRRRNLTLPFKDTFYSLHMTASRFTTN